jgi:hypothetical protein
MLRRYSLGAEFLLWLILGFAAGLLALSIIADACPRAQQENWWWKFWCEVKASDALVAYFTYTLFIVGWFAIRNASRSNRELERAYVYGGGPWIFHAPPLFPQVVGFN